MTTEFWVGLAVQGVLILIYAERRFTRIETKLDHLWRRHEAGNGREKPKAKAATV